MLAALLDALTDETGRPIFGQTDFRYTTFSERSDFRGARFRSATFGKAVFLGPAMLGATTFDGAARFSQATFADTASFFGASFRERASFDCTEFQRTCSFGHVSFMRDSWFQGLECRDEILIFQVDVAGDLTMSNALFEKALTFSNISCKGSIDFQGAQFGDQSRIGPCQSQSIDLSGVILGDGLAVTCSTARFSIDIAASARMSLRVTGPVYIDAPELIARGSACCRVADRDVSLRGVQFAAPAVVASSEDDARRTTLLRVCELVGVDTANLNLVDVDLSDCLLIDCLNLDLIRLSGRTAFATPPSHLGLTQRQVIADEYSWRTTYGWRRARSAGSRLGNPGPSTRTLAHESAHHRAVGIQRLYRDLRTNRERAGDAPGAADFYYGEMEMRRHGSRPFSTERTLLTAYWMIAGYGLRASRAMLSLAILLAASSILFAIGGLDRNHRTSYVATSFDHRGHPVRFDTVETAGSPPGLRRALEYSVSESTSLLRSTTPTSRSVVGDIMAILDRLFGPLLLALALLAVRNRVRR